MLIIRAKKDDVIGTEELIDDVFGEGHHAHVARMLLSEDLTPERMEEIRESVRKKFPGLFETRRKSSLDKMIHEVKSRLDRRFREVGDA